MVFRLWEPSCLHQSIFSIKLYSHSLIYHFLSSALFFHDVQAWETSYCTSTSNIVLCNSPLSCSNCPRAHDFFWMKSLWYLSKFFGRTQCRELPLYAGSGEGCQWQALPSPVQCEETTTRTRDLPVTGGKTLPLAPGPPFICPSFLNSIFL